ncbi:MAG: T9SS type A sorting domain-containing protein [Bacteroidia bacterium]
MKTNVLFFFLVLLFNLTKAQSSLFNYVFYDNTNYVQVYAALETHERDFLFLTDTRIFKADTLGNVLWSKAMNGLQFSAVTATKDSNFVLVGGGVNWNNANIACIKIDKNGDTLWTKYIDLGSQAYLYCVQELVEGGYIVAGNQMMGSNDERLLVAKLDTSGNVMWAKTFDAGNASWGSYERLYSIKQTADSGFIATGYMNGAVLMKLSAAGNIEWAKRTQQNGLGLDVVVKNKEYMWLFKEDGYGTLAKMDSSGNLLTHKSYTQWGGAVDLTHYIPPSKLYAIANNRYLFTFRNGYWDWSNSPILNTDSLGNILWSNSPGMYVQGVIETHNHNFLAIGNGPLQGIRQTGAMMYDFPHTGVAKLNALGYGGMCTDPTSVDTVTHPVSLNNVTLTSTNINTYQLLPCPAFQNVTTLMNVDCVGFSGSITDGQTPIFSIYPNPSTGTFQFQQNTVTPLQFDKIEIYNVIGKKVADFTQPDMSQLEIDLSLQPEGVYFVVAYQQGKMGTQKVRIERE